MASSLHLSLHAGWFGLLGTHRKGSLSFSPHFLKRGNERQYQNPRQVVTAASAIAPGACFSHRLHGKWEHTSPASRSFPGSRQVLLPSPPHPGDQWSHLLPSSDWGWEGPCTRALSQGGMKEDRLKFFHRYLDSSPVSHLACDFGNVVYSVFISVFSP